MSYVIVFSIENQQFGLDLTAIERIVHAVEITSLPQSSLMIEGIINFEGTIIPLINMRKWLNMPSKEIEIEDQFIICQSQSKIFALWIDRVNDILSYIQEHLSSSSTVQSIDKHIIDQVIKKNGHLILMIDLNKILKHLESHFQPFTAEL